MQLQTPVDTNTASTYEGGFEPLPVGFYNGSITNIEQKVPKNKPDQWYLSVEFTLSGNPKYDGRKVWSILSLGSKNPKAVEVSSSILAAIGKACGIDGMLTDTDQVMNVPIQAKLSLEAAQNGYAAKNGINGWQAYNVTAPSSAPAPAPAASLPNGGGQAAPAPAGNPWD